MAPLSHAKRKWSTFNWFVMVITINDKIIKMGHQWSHQCLCKRAENVHEIIHPFIQFGFRWRSCEFAGMSEFVLRNSMLHCYQHYQRCCRSWSSSKNWFTLPTNSDQAHFRLTKISSTWNFERIKKARIFTNFKEICIFQFLRNPPAVSSTWWYRLTELFEKCHHQVKRKYFLSYQRSINQPISDKRSTKLTQLTRDKRSKELNENKKYLPKNAPLHWSWDTSINIGKFVKIMRNSARSSPPYLPYLIVEKSIMKTS